MGNRLTVNALKLFVLVCLGVCEGRLTTALLKQSTSPKPSTIYRRINVYRSADVPEFETVETRRRNTRTRSQIWNWDSWCLLQPKRGNCDQKINRFYYNRQLDECSPFSYSGCDANENNFETKVECERRCSGVNSLMTTNDKIARSHPCKDQPDIGGCLAYDTMYYYDINRSNCSKFVYGGCAGNSNRFETLFECMDTCKVNKNNYKSSV